jgi:hypothetical protein
MDSDSTPDPWDHDEDDRNPVPSPESTVTNRSASLTATHMSNDSDSTTNNVEDYERVLKVSTLTSPYTTNKERTDYTHTLKTPPIYPKPNDGRNNGFAPPPSTAGHSIAEVRAHYLRSLPYFGELNLTHPNVQEFDDLVEPDDEVTDTTPLTFANAVSAVIAHGTLPPQFYRLPKPSTTPVTRPAPPQATVTLNPQENRCIHIYLTEIVSWYPTWDTIPPLTTVFLQ